MTLAAGSFCFWIMGWGGDIVVVAPRGLSDATLKVFCIHVCQVVPVYDISYLLAACFSSSI